MGVKVRDKLDKIAEWVQKAQGQACTTDDTHALQLCIAHVTP